MFTGRLINLYRSYRQLQSTLFPTRVRSIRLPHCHHMHSTAYYSSLPAHYHCIMYAWFHKRTRAARHWSAYSRSQPDIHSRIALPCWATNVSFAYGTTRCETTRRTNSQNTCAWVKITWWWRHTYMWVQQTDIHRCWRRGGDVTDGATVQARLHYRDVAAHGAETRGKGLHE